MVRPSDLRLCWPLRRLTDHCCCCCCCCHCNAECILWITVCTNSLNTVVAAVVLGDPQQKHTNMGAERTKLGLVVLFVGCGVFSSTMYGLRMGTNDGIIGVHEGIWSALWLVCNVAAGAMLLALDVSDSGQRAGHWIVQFSSFWIGAAAAVLVQLATNLSWSIWR